MANGKLLRQLISSGLQGDLPNFRAASEAVIAEEREKKHHLLANDLEKLMYGTQSAGTPPPGHLKLASSMPANKDSGLSLLELRPVVRELQDIVLSDVAKSALEEIIQEHNRADLLRSFGLKPAQKLLFFGPPGCGENAGCRGHCRRFVSSVGGCAAGLGHFIFLG